MLRLQGWIQCSRLDVTRAEHREWIPWLVLSTSTRVFDLLFIKEKEQRKIEVRSVSWGSQSCEITGLAPGERLEEL